MSRESRVRLFLAFLILVLVLVNSQSLQLSYQSRAQLAAAFEASARAKAEGVRARSSRFGQIEDAGSSQSLNELAQAYGFDAICQLDWNAQSLSGLGGCETSGVSSPGAGFDRLDRRQRRLLLEEGWALSDVEFKYDRERAIAYGYLSLTDPNGILRVSVRAPELAQANRALRTTLIYQISALSLVLLTLMLFLNSLLAPQRRLVAEARNVAGDLGPSSSVGSVESSGGNSSGDESLFVLATLQGVVTRLRDKEQELEKLHQQEKTRADETEALSSDIIRSMTTGLISLEPDGSIALMNPAAENIFSVEPGGLVGKSFSESFSGSMELIGMVREALGPGRRALREHLRYETSATTTIHLGVSVLPLATLEGDRRGALCLMADLTEIMELRERLLLKDNLARLGEMAAGIAHEFRNGLATMLGNAKLLERTAEGEAALVVKSMIDESRALSRVVTEFLQFARPEPLRVEPFQLDRLVQDLFAEMAPRADAAGVRLESDMEPTEIVADELLLRKAVSNLLLNAIESVTEASTDNGRVDVHCHKDNGEVILQVLDNGDGLPKSGLDNIFTPFFTSKATGTGLGLSVVQKIAVSHQGSISAASRAEGGAVFTLRLPAEVPATPAAASLADHW